MSLATQGDLAEVLRRDKVHHNLTAALLVEQAIRRGEAQLASNGALVAYTGRTGRSDLCSLWPARQRCNTSIQTFKEIHR